MEIAVSTIIPRSAAAILARNKRSLNLAVEQYAAKTRVAGRDEVA
jgi:hypothetical protein